MDNCGAYNGELDNGIAVPASVSEIGIGTDDSRWQLAGTNGLPTNTQLRMSVHEGHLHISYSGGQVHDEEIVFPERPGSSHDIMANSIRGTASGNHVNHTIHTEITVAGTRNQNDNKMHPFGLLWSELEGSGLRKDHTSKTPFTGVFQQQLTNPVGGVAAPFEVIADSAYRRNTLPESNLYQDASDVRQLSHIDQEANSI